MPRANLPGIPFHTVHTVLVHSRLRESRAVSSVLYASHVQPDRLGPAVHRASLVRGTSACQQPAAFLSPSGLPQMAIDRTYRDPPQSARELKPRYFRSFELALPRVVAALE